MVSSDKHFSNVVGGKTTRPCDNCIRKRARWYCAADDAFLCQSCDGLIHAANPLARRHERLRLNRASLKLSLDKPVFPPPWVLGFRKKPRTPRAGNQHRHTCAGQTTKSEDSSMSMSMNMNPLHLVPEIGSDETTGASEEQVLHQVPVFDPKLTYDLNSLNALMLPSDTELAEFAADMENLLGKNLDDEEFAMEGLGLLGCRRKDSDESEEGLEKVKVEEDDQMRYEMVESEMEMMKEPFELSFDYDWEEKDEKVVVVEGNGYGGFTTVVKKLDEDDHHVEKYDKKKRILKLDFEGIIAAWNEQRSPWTTGDRPEFDADDCWPECMGGCGIMNHHPYGDMGMMTGNPAMLDGGREARVSRYREKRRTRLFSKKIRYEVRKLNAEKRPRMKGRFVKRASTLGFPLLGK
ncbi:hypothetical protein QVD17_18455 [Tagetes erecta]|uniref:Uncharacterized protein n=1 Tax=Tagetes erecta TaxID=13708 RepID=A0AAD8KP40_TARER|nr:hypothetical protein QVD17_18455 [Tagetes erecta]